MKPFRVAVGGIGFEANSFSAVLADKSTFRRVWERVGQDIVRDAPGARVETGGAISFFAQQDDVEVVPLFDAHAAAGGRIEQATYEHYRDRLLSMLADAMPVDGVYLALHGAAVAEREDDVDGAVLEAVRERVGPSVPIAVSLDLHASLTHRMVRHADAIVAYEHYPHIDMFETGWRAARLLHRQLRGEIAPVMAALRLPMIAACQHQNTLAGGPLTEMYALARSLEAEDAILSTSYLTVQHGIDHPDTGISVVTVADGDSEAAGRASRRMAGFLWENRRRFLVDYVEPAEAIRRGLAVEGGPIVLSEASDTIGGGSFGDSPVLAIALQRHAPDATSCVPITDPRTAAQAAAAGVGSRFAASIGAMLTPEYGDPLRAEVEVVALSDGVFRYLGDRFNNIDSFMGPSAHLRCGAMDILVMSEPSYEIGADQFAAMGIDPWTRKFVVAKNPMNFQLFYADAPMMIHVDTPGPTTGKITTEKWRNLRRPVFPLDDGFEPVFEDLS